MNNAVNIGAEVAAKCKAILEISQIFSGKETENNWEEREKSLLKLNGWIEEYNEEFASDYCATLKEILLDLLQVSLTLRTQLAIQCCHTLSLIVRALKDNFEPFTETTMQTALKLCSQTKKLVANAGTVLMKDIIVSVEYPKAFFIFYNSSLDKNANVRIRTAEFMQILMERERERQFSGKWFEYIEKYLQKALPDANKDVRSFSREILKIFCEIYPENGKNLIDSLDFSTRKQLSLASDESKQPSTPSRQSIKSFIAKKNTESVVDASAAVNSIENELLNSPQPNTSMVIEKSELESTENISEKSEVKNTVTENNVCAAEESKSQVEDLVEQTENLEISDAVVPTHNTVEIEDDEIIFVNHKNNQNEIKVENIKSTISMMKTDPTTVSTPTRILQAKDVLSYSPATPSSQFASQIDDIIARLNNSSLSLNDLRKLMKASREDILSPQHISLILREIRSAFLIENEEIKTFEYEMLYILENLVLNQGDGLNDDECFEILGMLNARINKAKSTWEKIEFERIYSVCATRFKNLVLSHTKNIENEAEMLYASLPEMIDALDQNTDLEMLENMFLFLQKGMKENSSVIKQNSYHSLISLKRKFGPVILEKMQMTPKERSLLSLLENQL